MAEKKRETAAEARAAAALEAKSMFSLNKDDLFSRIVNGPQADHSNAPSGFVDPSAARKARMVEATGKADGPEEHHMDWNNFLGKINPKLASASAKKGGPAGYSYQNNNTISIALGNRMMEKFQPFVNVLSTFKFAADSEKREAQMNELMLGMKTAMHKLAINEVVSNTKEAYDNAVKFYRLETGLRVVFKVASSHVSVTAEGDFSGDEIVCLEQDGTNVTAYVARVAGEGIEDLTSAYNIKMELAR